MVDVIHRKMNLRLSERTLGQMNLLYRETSRFEPRDGMRCEFTGILGDHKSMQRARFPRCEASANGDH